MYEGVDTVILNNELAYEDVLPVAFKPLSRPLAPADATALADRNVRLLQVCAAIEEQGAVERKDEASPHSADLLRLEVKVNLLLDLMGQLLAAQTPRPRPTLIRFNAHRCAMEIAGARAYRDTWGAGDLAARQSAPVARPGRQRHEHPE